MSYKNCYIDVPKEVDASSWTDYGPELTTAIDWTYSLKTYSYSVSLGISPKVTLTVRSYSIEVWNGKAFAEPDRSACIITKGPSIGGAATNVLVFSFRSPELEADTPIRISATYGYSKIVTSPNEYSYAYIGSNPMTIDGRILGSAWSYSGGTFSSTTWSAKYALPKGIGKVTSIDLVLIGVSTGTNKACVYEAPSATYPNGALKFSFTDARFIQLPASVSVSAVIVATGGPMIVKSDTEKIDLDKITITTTFRSSDISIYATNLNNTTVYFDPINVLYITSSSTPWTDTNWKNTGWIRDPATIPANTTSNLELFGIDDESVPKAFYADIRILDADNNLIGVLSVSKHE